MKIRNVLRRIYSQKKSLKAILSILQGQNYAVYETPNLSIDHPILVGTHHKTGTVWLLSIFKEICKKHSISLYLSQHKGYYPREGFYFCEHSDFSYVGNGVYFHEHSDFNFSIFKKAYRGVHLIRDPRDVIVSGCFYHKVSGEMWLHQGLEEFDGLTYQEKLNSYSSLDDQLLFEMAHSSKTVINRMLKWDYCNPAFFELKYEDLIVDTDLRLFHEVFVFLGFDGKTIPYLLKIAFDNSVFSGELKTNHIRSGKTGQWKEYFKPVHIKRFYELFGDSLTRLGYE